MLKTVPRILIVACLAFQAFGSGVDDKLFFAARRESVMKRIGGSIALLEGAANTRAYVAFRQNNDFYYLTGVEAPGAYLIIDAVNHRSRLFLPPRNRMQEIWEGPGLYPGEDTRKLTGCDEVLENSRLLPELEKLQGSFQSVYIPMKPEETAAVSRDRASQFDLDRERNPWDGRASRARAFEQNLRGKLGQSASVKDLSPILDDMRRVKDTQEIERMRESARIGARGLMEAIRAARPGLYEYQLGAAAEFIFKWHGAAGPAYFPVVGSGPNSCILHYHQNDRKMEAGDLIVMDFGPDYRYYTSDITRTYPVSRSFSDEQAKVYQAVLDAQKAAIRKVRPGSTFAEVSAAAREAIAGAGYLKYWLHGVSHYVGMSTHDVGDMHPLEPGVIISVEPGIYIPEKNMGIRIEDTVLVTKDGCEVLTKDVPKELREIERLRSEHSSLVPNDY